MRALLSSPLAYHVFRRLIAGQDLNRILISEYVRPQPQDRILDIGCGPASIVDFLPSQASYVGFDPSAAYIEAARSRYRARAAFHTGIATVDRVAALGPFDVVLSIGVLHHLDDEAAVGLCEVAHSALREGGRFITLDGCFEEGQSRAARFLLSRDRGRFVRSMPNYRALAQNVFAEVKTHVRSDLLRIPYTHLIMECSKA